MVTGCRSCRRKRLRNSSSRFGIRAPRPPRRPGAGCSKSLVLMGDPLPVRASGPRTKVRHGPSTRIPSPSHAAAAACLSTSGPPAFRHPPRRALPDPQARPGSLPVTRDTSRHDLVTTGTPDSSPGSAVIPRYSVALLAVGVCPRPRATANVAYGAFAMRRPPTAAQPQRRHMNTFRCRHNAGRFVRRRHPKATSDCGAP